jgi:hypothetical protein
MLGAVRNAIADALANSLEDVRDEVYRGGATEADLKAAQDWLQAQAKIP